MLTFCSVLPYTENSLRIAASNPRLITNFLEKFRISFSSSYAHTDRAMFKKHLNDSFFSFMWLCYQTDSSYMYLFLFVLDFRVFLKSCWFNEFYECIKFLQSQTQQRLNWWMYNIWTWFKRQSNLKRYIQSSPIPPHFPLRWANLSIKYVYIYI